MHASIPHLLPMTSDGLAGGGDGDELGKSKENEHAAWGMGNSGGRGAMSGKKKRMGGGGGGVHDCQRRRQFSPPSPLPRPPPLPGCGGLPCATTAAARRTCAARPHRRGTGGGGGESGIPKEEPGRARGDPGAAPNAHSPPPAARCPLGAVCRQSRRAGREEGGRGGQGRGVGAGAAAVRAPSATSAQRLVPGWRQIELTHACLESGS